MSGVYEEGTQEEDNHHCCSFPLQSGREEGVGGPGGAGCGGCGGQSQTDRQVRGKCEAPVEAPLGKTLIPSRRLAASNFFEMIKLNGK